MKKIPLSGKLGIGKFTIVDDNDFEKYSKRKWHWGKEGYAASYNPKFGDGRRVEMLHRLIMNLKKGELGDHKDGNRLNNRRNNLRKCTKQQNGMNRRKSIGKSSKYKGVCYTISVYKGKPYPPFWRSVIMLNNKYISLGNFKTEIEAAKAYDKKAKELFGVFAKLNFSKAA